MSGLRYTPAIRTYCTGTGATGSYALPNPTAKVVTASVSTYGTNVTGTFVYKVAAYLDGAGLYHTNSSATASAAVSPSSQSVLLSWGDCWGGSTGCPGARWYRVFRRRTSGTPESVSTMVYQGSALTCYDNWTDGANYLGEEAPTTNNTTFTTPIPTYTVHQLRPDGGVNFNLFDIQSCRYVPEVETSADEKSVNRNLVVKRFGFRVHVAGRFQVSPGSTDEKTLVRLLGCNEAFPEADGRGVKMDLTLNYAAASPVWREVRIIGEYARMLDEAQTLWTIPVEFVTTGTIKSIPQPVSVTAGNPMDGTVSW